MVVLGSGIRAGKVVKTPGGDWYVDKKELDLPLTVCDCVAAAGGPKLALRTVNLEESMVRGLRTW